MEIDEWDVTLLYTNRSLIFKEISTQNKDYLIKSFMKKRIDSFDFPCKKTRYIIDFSKILYIEVKELKQC